MPAAINQTCVKTNKFPSRGPDYLRQGCYVITDFFFIVTKISKHYSMNLHQIFTLHGLIYNLLFFGMICNQFWVKAFFTGFVGPAKWSCGFFISLYFGVSSGLKLSFTLFL